MIYTPANKVLKLTAAEVFNQNDGDVTKAYYTDLTTHLPFGPLAVALFRAQKRSIAAKRYRGHRYRSATYDVKNWSLQQVCELEFIQKMRPRHEWQ